MSVFRSELSSLAEVRWERPLSAAERVADAVREQASDGQLAPGVRLTEEVVAGHMGVSRNTVREALAMLAAQGIVERIANRGVFVVQPTAEMVRDLYRYRILVESAALAWGEDVTLRRVEELRRIVAEAEVAIASGQWHAVSTGNQRFHRAVVAASGSTALVRGFEQVLAIMRLCFQAAGEPDWQARYVPHNVAVVTLLEQGRREEAASVLRQYLAEARDELLDRLDRPVPERAGS